MDKKTQSFKIVFLATIYTMYSPTLYQLPQTND